MSKHKGDRLMTKKKANANPTKDFFIHMITRDLLLKDAIVELVDNSLDGAKRWRRDSDSDFSELSINITMDNNHFVIDDNCGGISLELAEKTLFSFGKPENTNNQELETTGIFGIGMKRTLFKLGNEFSIISTTQNSRFTVNLNVSEWAKVTGSNWEIDISSYDTKEYSTEECGTRIEVTGLFPPISLELNSTSFVNELISHLEKRVSNDIEKGLSIQINDIELKPTPISVISDGFIQPIKVTYKNDGVDVNMVLGISEPNPKEAGWYIYCNNRLIVSADKSSLTTWNDDNANHSTVQYHNKYAGFRGFVYFNSKSPDKLPWNTTKTSVDASSIVYMEAQIKMIEHFRKVKELIDILKKNESGEEPILSDELALIDEADHATYNTKDKIEVNPISISNAITSNDTYNYDKIKKPNANPLVTISYKKQKKEVEKVKEALDVTANKEVGIKTFEYYMEMECE